MQNNSINLTDKIIEAIQDRKGLGITVVDLSQVEGAPSSQFIICTGKSPTQVSAIADNIREFLRLQVDVKPYNYDGYRNSQWIVLDYGDIMVHVFVPEFREFYRLEELWSDAPTISIPDLD